MFTDNIKFTDNNGIQIEFNIFNLKVTTPYNTLYPVKDKDSYTFFNKEKPLFSCNSFTVDDSEGSMELFCNTFFKQGSDEIQKQLDAANSDLQDIYTAYDTNFGTEQYPSSNNPANVIGGMEHTNNNIYNALVAKGVTPATKHLEDYSKAIQSISGKAYVVDGMKFRCYDSDHGNIGYPENESINFSDYDFSKLSDGVELFGSVNYSDMTIFDKCTGVIDMSKQYMRINYMFAGCKLTKNFRKLFKNFNFISNSYISNNLFRDAWIIADTQDEINEFFNSFTIGTGDYMFSGMRLKKNTNGTDFSGASIPINFDSIYMSNALTGQPATTLQLKGYNLSGEINSFGAATKIQIEDTLDMSQVYLVDLVETGITSLTKSGTKFQNSNYEDIWPSSLCSATTEDCTIIMEGYTDYWTTVANNICTKTSGTNVIQTSSSDINNINVLGLTDTFTEKGWTIQER